MIFYPSTGYMLPFEYWCFYPDFRYHSVTLFLSLQATLIQASLFTRYGMTNHEASNLIIRVVYYKRILP